MRTPATTEPFFILRDEETQQTETESQAVTFPFPRLIADMQMAIADQLDMPTRSSFSWTCKEYLASYGDENFNCFAFADKCAELGYRALLHYSVERGGPFDHKTSCIAAANGRVNILQLHIRLKLDNELRVIFKNIGYVVRHWAEYATKVGCRQVFSWLRVEQWTHHSALKDVADAAIMRCNTDLAFDLYDRAKKIKPADSGQLRDDLLKQAAYSGHVEFVQRLLQNDPEDRQIDWVDLLERSLRFASENASFVEWCFEQNPALLIEERKKRLTNLGNQWVSYLQLAEKLGIKIAPEQFEPTPHYRQLPPIAVLKYLHERFSLPNGHFQADHVFSYADSEDDFLWLQRHGYPVVFSTSVIRELVRCEKIERLHWVLQQGVRPTLVNIEDVAMFRRPELLDRLWAVRADHVAIDANLLKKLLETWCRPRAEDLRDPSRFRFKRMLKTLEWVQGLGCEFNPSMTTQCDAFIYFIWHKRPKFLSDYYDEIERLNMPLSTDTQELLANIKNKKLNEK